MGLPRDIRLLDSRGELIAVPEGIAAAYGEGDRLLVAPGPEILHVPREEVERASEAVGRAAAAFQELGRIQDRQVSAFYNAFMAKLDDDAIWGQIDSANRQDVEAAQAAGRSTTRLAVSQKMREGMIAGLEEWRDLPSPVGRVIDTTSHRGWRMEHVISPLGVVAFVFEGRPNVLADATGVLRSGNTAVLRIGSDALGTARSIVDLALAPALRESGLPEGAVTLLDSRARSAGWALFSDPRVALAVARGSGRAAQQLGAVARQAGIPVSLHGTGGAWLVADHHAERERFYQAVFHSLDRKVCNTLNTVCIPRTRAGDLPLALLHALQARHGQDGCGFRMHLAPDAVPYFPRALLESDVQVTRAEGVFTEKIATLLEESELGREWEWEKTPEISVAIVEDLTHAAALFNRYSPQFIASLISDDPAAHDLFFQLVNAPFVGDGFTRWVDGQYALSRPELGLSNWQHGRLLGRGAILTGDGIFTVRYRARQQEVGLHR